MKDIISMRSLRLCCMVAGLMTASHPAQPQSSAHSPELTKEQSPKKIINAVRMYNDIVVDGILSEDEYKSPALTDFHQKDPDEGRPSRQKTDVWITYDDNALYIGAKLHDTAPDSVVSKLGRRDAGLNADFFYVAIDSYNDKRSGFFFLTYPSGAIIDGTMYNDAWDDDSWDGIWETAATIDNEGWNVEMRIPYSQLRFPKRDEYVWGINFARKIERHKEESHWSLVKKGSGIWVSGFGELHGIKNINPPERIEILPYFAAGTEALIDEPGNPFKKKVDFLGNVGADVKFGLGSNLTVNATINPDFGQVEVDPAIVNLSQFETFFDEKRPFFIEGSDYFNFGQSGANNNWGFNFGTPDFFYTRRVGRSPRGDVQHNGFEDIPRHTSILGAAKVSGKIADGWSLATVQAFTEREYGRVDDNGTRYKDIVEPFSYYGALRSLREFESGRYGVGLMTTAAIHDLSESYLLGSFNKRSYSAGLDGWAHIDSAKEWVVTGWLAGSRNEGDPARVVELQRGSLRYFQRPDVDYLEVDSNSTSLSGYAGRFALNKQKGNFYTNAAFGFISPGFEINDVGFQFRADVFNWHTVLGYRWFEPDGTFRSKNLNIAYAQSYDYGGRRIFEGLFLFSNVQYMNYWGTTLNIFVNPQYVDVRNTRGGPAMLTTNSYAFYLNTYTDPSTTISFFADVEAGRTESGGYRYYLSPGFEWRPTSGLFVSMAPSFVRDMTIAQWVDNVEDRSATHTFGTRHMFGKLHQEELAAVIRVNWTFTPKLSLQMFIQPLISVGSYSEFKELKRPLTYTFNRYGEGNSTVTPISDARGSVTSYRFDPDGNGPVRPFELENPDFNYKSFRGNAILRWEYMPGSTLYFAWTHGRSEDAHNIGTFKPFFRDINSLFRTEPENVFLVKVAYWLTPSALGL